ncbi:hypothetical protein WAI453_010118 [Rhynchosporium graminicola]
MVSLMIWTISRMPLRQSEFPKTKIKYEIFLALKVCQSLAAIMRSIPIIWETIRVADVFSQRSVNSILLVLDKQCPVMKSSWRFVGDSGGLLSGGLFLVRATDEEGDNLPEKHRSIATVVAVAGGFITTASILSWMVYCTVTYPGYQERLLQELVDHGVTNDTTWDPDLAHDLEFLSIPIQEVQYLHNPSCQPGRIALRDFIFPGGHRVPKDSVMTIAINYIHKTPNFRHDYARSALIARIRTR